MGNTKFVEKESFKIVGMSVKTTMKNNKIPNLWNEFMPRVEEIRDFCVPIVAIGLCPYEGVDYEDYNDETEFEYIAGIMVNEISEIPEGMISREIQTNKYAVFTHKGKLDNLGDSYQKAMIWLKENGKTLVNEDEFELYDERFKFGEDDSEMDIYFPIK
ncbi:MAG: GyrI-like domain-containing protein [Candidatus Cloacimonetes bacterium]|nr:GyrI-like domain-containing protein [Candidatus Cloacimonadota bacterium]